MKHVLKVMVLALLAGFVLSACYSTSITKRRYMKGYFVEHRAKNHSKSKSTETARVSKPEILPATANMKAGAVKAGLQTSAVADPDLHKPVTASAARAHKSNAQAQKQNYAQTVELAVKHPVRALNQAARLINSAAPADDALSLLWIVIVVILILYLLGLLFDGFGLGNLIHILGVIAVVLLILWLLRIL
jgi:hypothetical protein